MDSCLSRFNVIVEDQFSIEEKQRSRRRKSICLCAQRVTSVQGDRDSLLWPLAAVDVPLQFLGLLPN